MVIALNEKIVRYQKRIGLQGYEGLPFGTYLIRIRENIPRSNSPNNRKAGMLHAPAFYICISPVFLRILHIGNQQIR